MNRCPSDDWERYYEFECISNGEGAENMPWYFDPKTDNQHTEAEMITLETLCREWQAAKDEEARATARRRSTEDRMLSLIGIAETEEGTVNAKAPGGYKIKVTSRINRKVDSEMVQEIAAEHGLTEHLQTLFRWLPSLNVGAWKNTDASITDPLAKAITATPGRPSFKIEQENN